MPKQPIILSSATAFANMEKRPLLLASIFFVGWVICGKMSIDRLSGALPAIEIRWFFMAIVFCLFPPAFSFRMPEATETGFRIYMASMMAFFLFFSASIFWHTPTHLGHLFDVLHILLQIIVLVFLIQRYEKFGFVVAFTIIGIAYLLMISAFLQYYSLPEIYGSGLHAFGSPFTFHRIQFLSLMALIFLATQTNRDFHAALYILFSIPNMISIYLSLSKTSVLGLVFSGVVICFLLLIKRQWRLGLVWGIAMMVSWLVFQFSHIATFIDRIDDAFSTEVIADSRPGISTEVIADTEPTTCPNITEYGNRLGSYYISGNVTNIALSYCNDTPSKTGQYDLFCTSFCLSDRTSRLVLWVESLRRIWDATLLGSGPGNFVVAARNPYTGTSEMYHHPHNIFLEVILGTGVLGGGLFVICIIAGFSPFLDITRLRLGNIPALGGLVYFLLGAQLGGGFYDFRLFWLIAIVILYSKQFLVTDPTGGR